MRILFLLYSIFLFLFAGAGLKAQGYTGKVISDSPYISVKLSSFTGWQSIADQWGVSAEKLQQVNPSTLPSSPGAPVEILIPVFYLLKSEPCGNCGPVYHSVGKSEGLYRIGKLYGNQPVSVLKKRNNLRSDALQPGQQLLVGYIATPGQEAAGSSSPASDFVSADTNIVKTTGLVAEELKEIPKPDPPRKILTYSGEGAFAAEFSQEKGMVIKRSGKACSFKTETGWDDGKFYVLNSNLKAGLVIKISNQLTGGYLYAKVVGPLPDIKQNQGLSLRLSNAAAAMLGFWEDEKTFELNWEY
jgi:LysM repeat protein